MKLLILSLFILMHGGPCSVANANFWAEGTNTVYTNLSKCEGKENAQCFDVSECAPNRCSPKDVEVPDFDKEPIQVVTDEVPCADQEACEALIAEPTFCSDESYQALWGDRNEDGSLSAWCIHNEWPTKIVKQMRPDQDKIDAIEAREQRKAEKQAKVEQIKIDLQGCAAVLEGEVQPPKLQECLEKVVKWAMRNNLALEDL